MAKVPVKYSECFHESCEPFIDTSGAEVNSRVRLYNRRIDQFVRMNQLEVTPGCALSPPDFYRYFELAAIGENGLPLEFNDPWHPNEQGYQAMAELWQNAMREGVCLKWPRFSLQGGGVYGSPAIGVDGTIYLGVGNFLHAINPDGTQKWFVALGTEGLMGSPAIDSDGTIYIGSANGDVHAIRPDGTEKQNWPFNTGAVVVSSPAIGVGNTIYVGSDDGKVYAINPNGTIKENWPFTIGHIVRSSPGIGNDGTIYVGDVAGYLYAIEIDSKNPARSAWPTFRHDSRNTGRVSAP